VESNTMARLSQADLVDLNKTFEERTPVELIRWAHDLFGERLAAISAMQKAGSVLCHLMSRLGLDLKVLFVDTGVNFPETLENRDLIAERYGLQVITLSPELSMAEQTEKFGVLYLSVEGQQQCCDMRKTQPLLKAKGQYDALFGSLRRSDGGKRESCPILAVDEQMNCLRINPMATMDDDQMEQYIAENDVIVNPLHEQGFSTISCNRCTTPVLPNEPKRAGRWRHLGPWSAYCGINPTDLNQTTSPAIDFPSDLVDRILGRETDFMI
jgi:phosphoadenosine phosphosulfate reductase